MCGALAMRPPPASKMAQEKSSRSLMLTECAVLRSRTPICSATDMNRLLKISSMTGSTAVPAGRRSGRSATRVSSRSPGPVSSARQPGSVTVVAKSSTISAGPSTRWPGRRSRRRTSGTSACAPATYIVTVAPAPPACPGAGGPPPEIPPGAGPPGGCAASTAGAAGAAASSTDTASTRIVLPRMRKEKCCR